MGQTVALSGGKHSKHRRRSGSHKRRRAKSGGKHKRSGSRKHRGAGMIGTAALPFGLLALQRLMIKRNAHSSTKPHGSMKRHHRRR